jgi:thioesterase domain-containing protein/acyl carrier protein
VAPRTLIETVLVDVYAGLLNLDRVGIEDNFFDLGGNSLQAMQLITRLRKDLAVDTDVAAIFLAPTPAGLAAALCERYGLQDSALDEADLDELRQLSDEDAAEMLASLDRPTPSGPLVPLNDGPADAPLFLVHAVGGTVYAYAHLAKELSEHTKVYGLEAAGLRDGSVAVDRLDDVVAAYTTAIREVQPDGPYRLGGWSMGGLIALEIAREMERSGAEVAMVALLDAPVYPADLTGWPEERVAAQFVADAARTLGPEAGSAPVGGTVNDQLGWLADRLTKGADDGGAGRAEIARRFDVFQAHMRLIAGYRPSPVRAPMVLIGARDSYDFTAEWAEALGPDAQPVRVPGDHYSFLQPPGVHEVAAAVRHDHLVAR